MKHIIVFFLLTLVLALQAQQLDITGTLYDFKNVDQPGGHPDFNFNPICGLQKGLVETTLGDDNKPVLSSNTKGCMHTKEDFDQWFRDTPGVNIVSEYSITAYWNDQSKSYTYTNNNFFPLDDQGWGNEYKPHNYGFCYEFHTQFTYQQGQVYSFEGDDDVWVFINKQLVIDLGGVHGPAGDQVNLDNLNLELGNTYHLDFFFCERHQSGSDMKFSTSIVLDPCGTVDSDGDGNPDLCDPCPLGDQEMVMKKDDHIGPNNEVTFTLAWKNPQTLDAPYPVTVDYGDGKTETVDVSTSSTWKHTYGKDGEYTVDFAGSMRGCGSWADSLTFELKQKRVAPKCSEVKMIPIVGKRKRSL